MKKKNLLKSFPFAIQIDDQGVKSVESGFRGWFLLDTELLTMHNHSKTVSRTDTTIPFIQQSNWILTYNPRRLWSRTGP